MVEKWINNDELGKLGKAYIHIQIDGLDAWNNKTTSWIVGNVAMYFGVFLSLESKSEAAIWGLLVVLLIYLGYKKLPNNYRYKM